MGFSTDLRAEHAATWDAAVGHRFVDELWAGIVDDAVLGRYLAQDAQFFDAFVALLGAAVAHADRPAPRLVLARALAAIANDEDDYFDRALHRLGVPDQEAEPLAPTRGFLDLMGEAVRSGDYPTVLTVLLVAEWLYLDWASRDAPAPADWVHRDWIDLHRGRRFTDWVRFLRDETDRVADAEPGARGRMSVTFGRAVALELAFFDAAY